MKSLSLPQIKLHSLLSAYGANFLHCLSADCNRAKHHVFLKLGFCRRIFNISLEELKTSKDESWSWNMKYWTQWSLWVPSNLRYAIESWLCPWMSICFPLECSSFCFFMTAKYIQWTAFQPTQYIKKLRPGVANLYIQQPPLLSC